MTSKRRKTKRSKDAVRWKETNKVKVQSGGQSPKWRTKSKVEEGRDVRGESG